MKFYSRILTILLVAVMLLCSIPVSVFAKADGIGNYIIETGSSVLYIRSGPGTSYSKLGSLSNGQVVSVTEISNGNWGKIAYGVATGWICLDYASRTTAAPAPTVGKQYSISADGLALIKYFEGYRQYKYWDYGHYSIGYGSTCGENDYPNGITEEEASALLLANMSSYENTLDTFLSKYGIKVTQKQYDALLSFTYNLGKPWTKYDEFDLKTILINGAENYTPEEIRAAFGQFVKAGGVTLSGLVSRRNKEADMFIAGTIFANKTFKDVTSRSWYFDAVEYVNVKGIMTGVSGGYFKPDELLSRAMMVTILGKIEKINTNLYKNKTSFTDVDTKDWFAPYVQWAYESSVTTGTGYGTFEPEKSISRQDLVVMLYNYTKSEGINTNAYNASLTGYSDHANISSYAQQAMKWAVGSGCISGTTEGQLTPKKQASRAETAQIMKNYMQKIMA